MAGTRCPTPEDFAESLGALGIGNDDVVVAYDDRGGAFAGRLVWMLRMIGQPAALLDGGSATWTGPVETGTGVGRARRASCRPWPADRIVDADEVVAHIATGGVVVDSRERVRYLGETEPIDRIAGHVPGAINLPFAENLDATGVFHPADRLAERFEPLRADPAAIVYCGSGVTACHNALAIEAAGLPTSPRVRRIMVRLDRRPRPPDRHRPEPLSPSFPRLCQANSERASRGDR